MSSSKVLVIGSDRISSLVPSTAAAQLDGLLAARRIEQAVQLVAAHDGNGYLHVRLAFALYAQTRFLDAVPHFCAADNDLDPRVLLSCFPDVADGLFGEDDEAEVFVGVDDSELIDVNSVVANYSPHLTPDARPLPELHAILVDDAHSMLEAVLQHARARAWPDEVQVAIDTALTKLLCRTLCSPSAQQPSPPIEPLLLFLSSPNSASLPILAAFLERNRHYAVLCALYELRCEWPALLDALARFADGTWSDPAADNASAYTDPISRMCGVLSSPDLPATVTSTIPHSHPQTHTQPRDALIRHWAIWMVPRDLECGMWLLTEVCPRPGGDVSARSRSETTTSTKPISAKSTSTKQPKRTVNLATPAERGTLQELRALSLSMDTQAAQRYLEWLVLVRRCEDPDLHTALASSCLAAVCDALDEGDAVDGGEDGLDEDSLEVREGKVREGPTSRLWRAKVSSYVSSATRNSRSRSPRRATSPTAAHPTSPSPRPSFSSTQPRRSSPSPFHPAADAVPFASTHPQPPSSSPPTQTHPTPTQTQTQPHPQPTTFISYFTSTTPRSHAKAARLRTVAMLQGSTAYDVHALHAQLYAWIDGTSGSAGDRVDGTHNTRRDRDRERRSTVLALERAILEGKLANHRAALTILVHDLRDAASAEAYCASGGRAVVRLPKGLAGANASGGRDANGSDDQIGGGWDVGSEWLFSGMSADDRAGEDKERRTALLRVLLEVYTADGESTLARRLLDTQGGGMDVVELLPTLPPAWPLSTLRTLLARSFRASLHARHEGMIVKGVCAGENLEVMYSSWPVLRDQGAIVEEAVDDSDEDDENDTVANEKAYMDEKTAAVLADRAGLQKMNVNVVDVELAGAGEGLG
ncbi:hypothetical protein BJ138DRAFT_1069820 [Hygrophoropsis aurantiaca]|uniref:Uncharacterized protein n=1 Tax=Hygrophoropsis aurantiaca TaxID=72124 RepID=A0ACB8A2M2_9AGAM|nr:hypothetical protein BJ138DRAFT_1069820 [Hygrophoropsis aurantiaca]